MSSKHSSIHLQRVSVLLVIKQRGLRHFGIQQKLLCGSLYEKRIEKIFYSGTETCRIIGDKMFLLDIINAVTVKLQSHYPIQSEHTNNYRSWMNQLMQNIYKTFRTTIDIGGCVCLVPGCAVLCILNLEEGK